MSHFRLGILFSGLFHLAAFAAPEFLGFHPPLATVMTGPTSVRVVFLEKRPPEEVKKAIVEKAEEAVKPVEVQEEPPEESSVEESPAFVSLESEGVVENDEVRYAHNPPPRYPRAALLKEIQGSLLLLAEVDTEGQPLQVRVAESSGYSILDEAALEAVRKWQFIPARIGTVAVRSQVRIPVQFKIAEKK